ncbi:hypothetical protein BHE74_00010876 [Ensete ventricosum]|nr:hypothetical protein GW17_00001895 [Ensete ventricosum]RWW80767.1 hypothetical protein BHE74_00010876 [Ensete ventricosum]
MKMRRKWSGTVSFSWRTVRSYCMYMVIGGDPIPNVSGRTEGGNLLRKENAVCARADGHWAKHSGPTRATSATDLVADAVRQKETVSCWSRCR